MVPPEQHTPAQAASWALSQELVAELLAADTIPQMAEQRPLAAESLASAEREIDALWTAAAV